MHLVDQLPQVLEERQGRLDARTTTCPEQRVSVSLQTSAGRQRTCRKRGEQPLASRNPQARRRQCADELVLRQRPLQDLVEFVAKFRAGEVGDLDAVRDDILVELAGRDIRGAAAGRRDGGVGKLRRYSVSRAACEHEEEPTHEEGSPRADPRITTGPITSLEGVMADVEVRADGGAAEEAALFRQHLLV